MFKENRFINYRKISASDLNPEKGSDTLSGFQQEVLSLYQKEKDKRVLIKDKSKLDESSLAGLDKSKLNIVEKGFLKILNPVIDNYEKLSPEEKSKSENQIAGIFSETWDKFSETGEEIASDLVELSLNTGEKMFNILFKRNPVLSLKVVKTYLLRRWNLNSNDKLKIEQILDSAMSLFKRKDNKGQSSILSSLKSLISTERGVNTFFDESAIENGVTFASEVFSELSNRNKTDQDFDLGSILKTFVDKIMNNVDSLNIVNYFQEILHCNSIPSLLKNVFSLLTDKKLTRIIPKENIQNLLNIVKQTSSENLNLDTFIKCFENMAPKDMISIYQKLIK